MYNIKAMILTSSVCSDMHVRRSASVQVLGALQKAETNMAVQPTVDRGDYRWRLDCSVSRVLARVAMLTARGY